MGRKHLTRCFLRFFKSKECCTSTSNRCIQIRQYSLCSSKFSLLPKAGFLHRAFLFQKEAGRVNLQNPQESKGELQ